MKDNGNILVIDDNPENLRLLVSLLKEEGYMVRPVPNGKLAISSAQAIPPDLILLDIKMPEMDGYELCQKFKNLNETKDIPVIFLSALNETLDKIKAFAVGGVDYITKPFHQEEVLVRVKTHLTLQKAKQEAEEKNNQLQREIAERKQVEEKLREDRKSVV